MLKKKELGVHKGREWNGIIIREWKRMEWNDHKGMGRNRMYLSKGKKWKRI